jgi:hypothetical protein
MTGMAKSVVIIGGIDDAVDARLRAMLVNRISWADYDAVFDRRNLINERGWLRVHRAHIRAARMRRGLRGRVVILLGDEVRRAFGIPRLLVYPQMIDGVTWRQIPYSRRWYNDERNRVVVELLLEDLYTQ